MAREEGFTLLEVLIAVVIAGLALAVLFDGAAGGLRSARLSDHEQEALSRARSRLAVIGRGAPLADADQQGDDGGGFHWRTRVTTIAAAPLPAPGDSRGPLLALHEVEVVISWRSDGGDRQVALRTERTGVAAPAAP